MKPIPEFSQKNKAFWACVRSVSQNLGYSKRKKGGAEGELFIHNIEDIVRAFNNLGLNPDKIFSEGNPTQLGIDLQTYFAARADILTNHIRPRLMDAADARKLFQEQFEKLRPNCPIPMNKQKGDKRAESFLTGLVNMTIEAEIGNLPCDYDPLALATVTQDGLPLMTMARRVDGAFPSPINPIAIWEIKEYYYTTTFGSRVADGVYESLLDGMELEELDSRSEIRIKHYLIVDSAFTWWTCGKSYLCRIFDMLHMGYVDEVLFGREVVEELPRIVSEWIETYRSLEAAH